MWNLRDEKEGGRGGKNMEGHGGQIGPITRWEKPCYGQSKHNQIERGLCILPLYEGIMVHLS